MACAEAHQNAETAITKRKIVHEIIERLRGDGFRFLDVKRCDGQVGGLKQMDSTSTHKKVVKALLGSKSTARCKDKGHTAHETVIEAGTTTICEKDILMGSLLKVTLKHPGNVECCKKVMSVFPHFQESIKPGEKFAIATNIVDNLHKKGYCFVVESSDVGPDVGMWMPVDVNRAVDKVNKYLRDRAHALQDKHFGKNKEKGILCGGNPKHLGNVAYHTKVMIVFPRLQVDTPSDKKDAIVKSVVNDLQKEGYQFVAQIRQSSMGGSFT